MTPLAGIIPITRIARITRIAGFTTAALLIALAAACTDDTSPALTDTGAGGGPGFDGLPPVSDATPLPDAAPPLDARPDADPDPCDPDPCALGETCTPPPARVAWSVPPSVVIGPASTSAGVEA